MLKILQQLCEKGMIRQLDRQFARFIYAIETQHTEEIAFIAAIVSQQLSQGHICIKPGELNLSDRLGLYGDLARQIDKEISHLNWDIILTSSDVVGNETDNRNQPLIYDGHRLYLHRYWYYEKCLSQSLKTLAEPVPLADELSQQLAESLNNLFPDTEPVTKEVNWQKVAVAVALSRRLSVISGGPGTGKTTTVVKLLAALVEQGVQQGRLPDIKLVAPTGKAAARLTESIGSAVESLSVSQEIKSHIPVQAGTIHRLLGAIPNRAEFRHHSLNPLHLDVLVVDEASMVDLPLMAKLMEALPPHARLILLGDKDQLSSVEAGAVLGDICSFIDHGYSETQITLLSRLTATDTACFSVPANSKSANRISDSLCLLKKSYRFDKDSGIGTLATAINSVNLRDVVTILGKQQQDVTYRPLTSQSYHNMIDFVATQYEAYLDCVIDSTGCDATQINKVALKALTLFSECRLLCAVREGDFGLSGLNRAIERVLAHKQKIPLNDDIWYLGRPVMITRNDHALGLYNGDIGIAMPVSQQDGADSHYLKVFFELPDGTIKSVLPSRLSEHDTAYAMTVHKSQGSEFPVTVFVVPDRISPVVTKELIYTAVTRAKQQLHIYADQQILLTGVKTKTKRLSGLRDRLL